MKWNITWYRVERTRLPNCCLRSCAIHPIASRQIDSLPLLGFLCAKKQINCIFKIQTFDSSTYRLSVARTQVSFGPVNCARSHSNRIFQENPIAFRYRLDMDAVDHLVATSVVQKWHSMHLFCAKAENIYNLFELSEPPKQKQ